VASPVKLVIGLGNPGAEYAHSPHNLGFDVVDRLALRHDVKLASRRSHSLCGHFVLGSEKEDAGPEALLVIHDELDLPWGAIQVRQRGGPAGHHGVESVIGALGTKDFARVRIGVAPEHSLDDPVSYLLAPIRRSQRDRMDEIVDQAADAAEMVLREGVSKAMNRFNRRERPPAEADSNAR
jgi:PTH1 family peptidyl-tRNA hydrolase